jgi:hypothetical protein
MAMGRRSSLLLLLGFGCGLDDPGIDGPPPARTAAHVLGLSTYEASVGTLIEAYGYDFPTPGDGRVALVFDGTFESDDGQLVPASFEAPVRRVNGSTVRWTGFGPFDNPFHPGGGIGTFRGTVAARVVMSDGETLDDPNPTEIDFDVGPSLIVRELQPVTANCNGGVLRALGGASYRVAVEAIGFDPVSVTYSLSAPALDAYGVSVRHLPTSRFDSVGERGDFTVPPVPDGVPSYGAIMTIQAKDESGAVRQSVFGLNVHRPIEVFYNGNVEVAEVLAPVPVSGCIPGGINGREVEYGETQSESRSRNYEVAWNESWLAGHTVAVGSEDTVGLSETNGVGFSTTDGQSFRWSLGTEVSGEFGISELVSLGVNVTSEVGGEKSRQVSNNVNRESGVNASTTTTETEEISQQRGGEQGEAFAWSVSSDQAISTGFSGHVIAGTYGVFYRQTVRLTRRAAVVAYNQCGFAKVVGDVDFTDWQWSPDLALGNECPPLPASNLPTAECYVPPCSGD